MAISIIYFTNQFENDMKKKVLYLVINMVIILHPGYSQKDKNQASSSDLSNAGIKCLYWGVPMDQDYESRIDSVLSLDYITGIALYVDWKKFEPQLGMYQWEFIDIPLKQAIKHNKTISFGLMVASRSPSWLKQEAKTFTYMHIHPGVGKQTAPVPWDPVYKESLSRTIHAMGKRYDGNKHIYYITINGPSTLYGVETNWPMNYSLLNKEDKVSMDFSLKRFEQEWKNCIDLFMEAFPNTRLGLGLHYHIDIPEYTVEEKIKSCKSIRDYAIEKYGVNHPNDKIVLRLLGLCHDIPNYFAGEYSGPSSVNDFISMVWDRKEDVLIGYETTRIWSRKNSGGAIKDSMPAEYLLQVIKNGKSYEATSIEIKIPDIWDTERNTPFEPYVDALIYGNKVLTKE